MYLINLDCHLQIILVCEYQSFLKFLNNRTWIIRYKNIQKASSKKYLKFLFIWSFQDENDIITPQKYALFERVLENWIWPFFLAFDFLGSVHHMIFASVKTILKWRSKALTLPKKQSRETGFRKGVTILLLVIGRRVFCMLRFRIGLVKNKNITKMKSVVYLLILLEIVSPITGKRSLKKGKEWIL